MGGVDEAIETEFVSNRPEAADTSAVRKVVVGLDISRTFGQSVPFQRPSRSIARVQWVTLLMSQRLSLLRCTSRNLAALVTQSSGPRMLGPLG